MRVLLLGNHDAATENSFCLPSKAKNEHCAPPKNEKRDDIAKIVAFPSFPEQR